MKTHPSLVVIRVALIHLFITKPRTVNCSSQLPIVICVNTLTKINYIELLLLFNSNLPRSLSFPQSDVLTLFVTKINRYKINNPVSINSKPSRSVTTYTDKLPLCIWLWFPSFKTSAQSPICKTIQYKVYAL